MKKKGIVGLMNLGNTCYANTVVQCLMHTMPMTYFFMLNKHKESLNGEKQRLITLHWEQLLTVAWRKPETEAVSPKNFIKIIEIVSRQMKAENKVSSVFRAGQQHDCVEFLQFMLDCLHDSMVIPVGINISGTPRNRIDQLMIESYKQYQKHYESKYSVVVDMFSGQYFAQIVTRDNLGPAEHSETFDPFTILTLELPPAARRCTLYDCFDMLIRPEIITGWKGERCSTERLIEKKTFLWKLPNILVIHLKRFVNMYVKNMCQVQIPETIDLTNYCMGYDNEHAKYQLYAVANHIGTLHFGHYYADCKSLRNGWHRFDDHKVTSIQASDIRENYAYCLFYFRTPCDGTTPAAAKT